MKFKFGDKVRVIEGFYVDQKGIVTRFCERYSDVKGETKLMYHYHVVLSYPDLAANGNTATLREDHLESIK